MFHLLVFQFLIVFFCFCFLGPRNANEPYEVLKDALWSTKYFK